MTTRRPKRPARGAASRSPTGKPKRPQRPAPRLKAAEGAERLTTVKVPPPFEAPFLSAQRYVQRYFAERVEQPSTATIAIAGERYVLMRAASLSVEFVEMVMKLYQDKGESEA
ncbi:MAG TPA: hypothetical protein VGT99_09205, partial [Gammaproteobacteria bacterium]|nr:hypothetical protein [Gammaproteobacteria bacterium]